MDITEFTGKELTRARQFLGLTRAAFATNTSVDRKTIARLEGLPTKLDSKVSVLRKIADYLDMCLVVTPPQPGAGIGFALRARPEGGRDAVDGVNR
jgi:transcriptional regulator with XRE-family HTH domain